MTASKKYAGKFALYKGRVAKDDAPIDIRGMEIVRSDVCGAARQVQRMVLEGVLEDDWTGEDAWAWLGEVKEVFLKPGRVPLEDVVLRKALTKHPKDYANDTPHVMVAKAAAAGGRRL